MDTKQEVKKIPYKPIPYRTGNNVVSVYTSPFVDSVGNKAIITKCDFIDKKGQLNEGYDLHIKWIEPTSEFTNLEKNDFISAFYNVDEKKYHLYYDGYLIYFFQYKNEYYLSYQWDSEYYFDTYMIFKLSDEFIIKDGDCDYLITEDDSFEKTMSHLVDNNFIEKFYAIKNYRFKEKELIEGNRAIMIFNSLYKKFLKEEVDYIL